MIYAETHEGKCALCVIILSTTPTLILTSGSIAFPISSHRTPFLPLKPLKITFTSYSATECRKVAHHLEMC